jgi:hypothetical protein
VAKKKKNNQQNQQNPFDTEFAEEQTGGNPLAEEQAQVSKKPKKK